MSGNHNRIACCAKGPDVSGKGKMRYLCAFLLVVMFAFVVPAGGAVAASGDARNVRVDLIADKTEVRGGETITVGIVETIRPGWHVYWRNPGDSGEATRVRWTSPEDLVAGDMEWPVPVKLPFGPLVNYGYEGRAILLQQVTLPENLSEGPVMLRADIDLLVCHEICIPESGTYTLALNAGTTANPDAIARAHAMLPRDTGWKTSLFEERGLLVLRVVSDDGAAPFPDASEIALFPEEWGLVDNTAQADARLINSGTTLEIRQARGQRDLADVPVSKIVIVSTDADGMREGVRVSALLEGADASVVMENGGMFAILQAMVFALLGGLILNLMPCVFPVLSMKALSLVKLKDKDAVKARRQGLVYAAGILVSFTVIAGLLIVLKSLGAQIGWGFQLQQPLVVAGLAYLVFVIALNLAGFFEIGGGRLAGAGGKLTGKDSLAGSFFTGVLATLVATPCSAPFMGAAMGFALTQPAWIAMAVFLMLGFGLALPYLALCFVPALRHVLPKPGHWMETFRQFLAFPMFATAAWLVWVLAQQISPTGVFCVLLGMVLVALALWLFRVRPSNGRKRFVTGVLAWLVLLISILSPVFVLGCMSSGTESVSQHIVWEAFSPERLETALAGDRPVLVNMTAAWCITCKVNERVALDTPETRALFIENNILSLKGDWTNRNANITAYLESYGRSGVPLYVYYGPKDSGTGQRPEPVVLPQLLTPAIVQNAVIH